MNQGLFYSEAHKISCEFPFVCDLKCTASLTVHFSCDTHSRIYLAFNNIMMIDLLIKTITFQMGHKSD